MIHNVEILKGEFWDLREESVLIVISNCYIMPFLSFYCFKLSHVWGLGGGHIFVLFYG